MVPALFDDDWIVEHTRCGDAPHEGGAQVRTTPMMSYCGSAGSLRTLV